MKPAHLTAEELLRYRLRTLAPADILRVDDHMASCEACRNRLYAESGGDAKLTGLREAFSEHLTYTDLEASATGSASPSVTGHLKDCARCSADAEDLRQFAAQLRKGRLEIMPARPTWWRAVAAAVAILAAGGVYLEHRRQHAVPVAHAPAPQPSAATPTPAPAENPTVALARASGRFERSPLLDRLVTQRGVLLSASPEKSGFEAVTPVGTAILADRPVFRWRPLSGASEYQISVFNEKFELIVESPALKTTEWQPGASLPKNVLLNWQITAKTGETTVHAPEPPAPEARFLVLDDDTAFQIRAAQQAHPDDALLLATLFANASALDAAEEQVQRLAATDARLADSLRASLKQLRRR